MNTIIHTLYTTIRAYNSICRRICQYLNKNINKPPTIPNLSYFIDVIDENHTSGWMWNPNKPNNSLSFDIFDNKHKLTTISANTFRQDLLSANIGDGKHAFNYIFPGTVRNNCIHHIKFFSKQNIFYSNYIFLPFNNFLRKLLSKIYIKGYGIEIGALHNPLWVSPKAKVKYVDRFDKKTLVKTYPELNSSPLKEVDIIDDGEKLSTISNDSLDFIICNHMLEHCQNPIGTIRNHLKKIKKDGILYYAIPNKRFTFDYPRKLTNLKHLINDDKLGAQKSRLSHLAEWATYIDKIDNKKELQKRVQFLNQINYSIHYHVWNEITFHRFLISSQIYLGKQFRLVYFVENEKEIISILKKSEFI